MYQGGCACGAVRYQLGAEPLTAFYCHCRDCQKNTGGPFSVDVIVPADAITLNGKLSEYRTTSATGNAVSRRFCPQCGSPVLNIPHGHPGIIALKVSSLDEPSRVKPQAHLWTQSMHAWVKLDDDLPRYQQDM